METEAPLQEFESCPLPVEGLSEPTSMAIAQQLQRVSLLTPLHPNPIATTFIRQGQGSVPVLLLHGFDSSVFEFRRLIPQLAAQHTTWAVDLLGFGFTERKSDVPITPEAINQHLYAFWKTLIAQPAVLVGASMGGAAAIAFALNHPEAVSKLVLLDSAGYTVGPALGQFLMPPLENWATAFLRSPKVRQDIAVKAYHDPVWASEDAARCAALHLSAPGWQQALISFTRSGGYRSYRTRLAELKQPTLILWGRSDRILGIRDAEKFAGAIAHSRLVWVDASGHVPHLEQPHFTANQIHQFITARSD
ncbi:alpha/beta fold hydrolase [Leptolyngbya sp. FACHB-8]|uniref:alpha/beta fold hydrolase n=1 Tax=unclassified Leptolyngbya TaxID=2650499 RepID=UPI001688E43C|nr:alpha/beta fold hydrolase [Leptolyngbya sp. FACHB-8]MBD1913604.1 alpha/beta fold hydrolase [Leptolyngbya sp. FACHB-8]